jgi:hypothetical protein
MKSFVVLPSIELLDDECFRDCASLSEVTFARGSHAKTIGVATFYGCGLLSFCVPASVEILSHWCFARCLSLAKITFERD